VNTNRTDIHKAFLQLARLGIGTGSESIQGLGDRFHGSVDWSVMRTLAEEQGMYAIVLDGIEKLPASVRPPQEMLLEWIGEVLQGYEYRFESMRGRLQNWRAFITRMGLK